MAPGDLLDLPGQVEWDGLLFDIAGPSESGLWLTMDTEVDGWWPLPDSDDQVTATRPVAGVSRPSLSYPLLSGVAVETAELVVDVEAALKPTSRPRLLCWYDRPRDLKVSVLAAPRGAVASTAQGVQMLSHRLMDVRWLRTDAVVCTVVEHETTVSGSNPTVPNAGSEPAPWRLVVEGACTGPRVRNLTTDQAWRFDDLVLTADQTLTVDTRAMTAVVSETGEDDIDVWNQAEDDGNKLPMLWGIAPGGTPVGFARTSGATTALLYSPDAY